MGDPQSLVDQYEALRCEATEDGWVGERGTGLALLLCRGMSAWLEAVAALAPPRRPPESESEPPRRARAPAPPASVRADLTTVLAGMVLACARPGSGG